MLRISFFKQRKPRQFEYRPLYYDPEKEAREKRRKELLGDQAGDAPGGEYKPGQFIRSNVALRRGNKTDTRNRQKAVRPIRLVIMLILLGVAVWWALT